MSIRGKLNRLKSEIVKEEISAPSQLNKPNEDIPYLEKCKSFGAEPFYFEDTYCLIRKVIYPLHFEHGLYPFSQLEEVVSRWNQSKVNHPLSANKFKPSDLFFFDTETTGLGGGVGNTIFLLGHARIENNKIVVTQHFLPNPGAEVALYQSFLSSVDYTTLVTYNGKAFDWPQVKTRHTLIRDSIPKLPEFGHFDLYHASRRLWKNQLESVKLSLVESEILGIKRNHDTPGYLAPVLYFHYLESQDPETIVGILKHNEIDVLSLITLYIHLSQKILSSVSDRTVAEGYEVARWLDSLGETEFAKDAYSLSASNEKNQIQAKLALAFIYKKQNELATSINLFKEVFNNGAEIEKLKAGIELSKYYEHVENDYERALEFTELSLKVWEYNLQNNTSFTLDEFEKRIRRLKRKLNKRN